MLCKQTALGCANLIVEFYANAQYDFSYRTPSVPTYKSCRGVEIDYSPDVIRRFLKFSSPAVDARIFGENKPTFHTLLNQYLQRKRFLILLLSREPFGDQLYLGD